MTSIHNVRRNDLENTEIELLWLKIKRVNSSSLFFGTVYRKPDATMSFFDVFEGVIDKLMSISNNVMIIGDFNCNMITNNSLSKKVKELCSTTNMKQLITEPITPQSKKLYLPRTQYQQLRLAYNVLALVIIH